MTRLAEVNEKGDSGTLGPEAMPHVHFGPKITYMPSRLTSKPPAGPIEPVPLAETGFDTLLPSDQKS